MPTPTPPNANTPQPGGGTSYRNYAIDRTGTRKGGRAARKSSRR